MWSIFNVLLASFFTSTISKKILPKHNNNNYGELERQYHYTWPTHKTEVCVKIYGEF